VARWAEMFNRVEQERDAALARVAELELKLDQSDYAYDNDRHHMRGMAKQAAEAIQVFTGHDSGANLAHRYGEKWWEHLDELRDALLAFAKNAPPAQAQHSVPDGAPPKGVLTVPDIQATYIEVSAEVRYWEDAKINGVEDENGTLTPFRSGNLWCPVIRLEDGTVMDWPAGMVADFHFKVCDAGQYWLLDDSRKRVAQWAGYYVPDEFLCPTENGYGDYIIFKVGADGLITGWRKPEIEWGGREDDQEGWKRLKENDRA
ncbi:hypothetical protein, partial [Pseudomonas aeruginosa]|uniref:hypothetical protein n=2 Tax=Pseudomonas aeruginosa TaxID=287 RepID=UPI000AD7D0FF